MCFNCSDDRFSTIRVHFCKAFIFLCHSAGLIVLLTTVYQVYVTNYLRDPDIIFLTFPDLLAGIDPAATLAAK